MARSSSASSWTAIVWTMPRSCAPSTLKPWAIGTLTARYRPNASKASVPTPKLLVIREKRPYAANRDSHCGIRRSGSDPLRHHPGLRRLDPPASLRHYDAKLRTGSPRRRLQRPAHPLGIADPVSLCHATWHSGCDVAGGVYALRPRTEGRRHADRGAGPGPRLGTQAEYARLQHPRHPPRRRTGEKDGAEFGDGRLLHRCHPVTK